MIDISGIEMSLSIGKILVLNYPKNENRDIEKHLLRLGEIY